MRNGNDAQKESAAAALWVLAENADNTFPIAQAKQAANADNKIPIAQAKQAAGRSDLLAKLQLTRAACLMCRAVLTLIHTRTRKCACSSRVNVRALHTRRMCVFSNTV